MEGPSSVLSGTGFELRMPEAAFLARVVFFSLFLPSLLDAIERDVHNIHVLVRPCQGKCTRMGNLGIRTLTVFPHGK